MLVIGELLIYVRVKYSVVIVKDKSVWLVVNETSPKFLLTTKEVALSSKMLSLLYSILINLGDKMLKRYLSPLTIFFWLGIKFL